MGECNGDFSKTKGRVISCKAAVAWGPKKPLVMEEIQVEPPGKMEVRIKIIYTSLCHSDVSFWEIQNEEVFPRIFGHEAAGIVESVGDGVEDFKEGDHVVPLFSGECGECKYCNSTKTNICGRFKVEPMRTVMRNNGTTRFSINGKPIYHFFSSTFSEYTVLDSACLAKIDPSYPLEEACLLSCCIATGVGAVWHNAKVEEGSTIAVFGLGSVGLAVVEGARLAKAARIIGIDSNPEKFAKAKMMGATDFINPKEETRPLHELVQEMCDGGVDYAFECVGKTSVMREAFLSTHDGWGLTIMIGIDAEPNMVSFNPLELFVGRRFEGSTFGGFKGKSQLPDLVKKCMNNEVRVKEFITHMLPFEKVNEAFELLFSGKSLRCVMSM